MKYITSVLLFLILISIQLSIEGEVELVLIEGPQKRAFYSRLCIGEPIQCLNVFIDFSNPFIWVNEAQSNIHSDVKYDLKKSNSKNEISNMVIQEKGVDINGTYIKDDIVFPQFTLKQVDIAIAIKGREFLFDIPGGLGLGFRIIDSNSFSPSSFIQELKNQKIINDRIFIFEKINVNNGRVSIGKVPEIMLKDYYHLGRCDLAYKQQERSNIITREWACLFNSITIGDNSEVYKDTQNRNLIINIQDYYIIVPISFLLFLEKTYFKNLIDKGECSIIKEDNNYYSFTCINNIPDLPPINFRIKNWKFALESQDLFYSIGYNYYFNIKALPNKNEWIIGEVALRHFIVLFDIENNLLGLYSNRLVSYIQHGDDVIPIPNYPISLPNFRNPSQYSALKLFGIILISICMIFGIFLLLRWQKRSKMIKFYQNKAKKDQLIS